LERQATIFMVKGQGFPGGLSSRAREANSSGHLYIRPVILKTIPGRIGMPDGHFHGVCVSTEGQESPESLSSQGHPFLPVVDQVSYFSEE
jgi:hypothetical protein